jgi:hypothetical protein
LPIASFMNENAAATQYDTQTCVPP